MKQHKSITETVQKQLPDFADEVANLDGPALEARIVVLAQNYGEVERSQEEDETLSQARDTARELNAPYIEAKKALRLKTKYLIELLKEKA